MSARPAQGTTVSSKVPTLWLSDARLGSPAGAVDGEGSLKAGQRQVAFVFSSAVTADVEQLLRRAIVTRVEVGTGDEFLVTQLDASRVSLVQRLLENMFWVALVLAVGAALYVALALKQAQAASDRILYDVGVTVREIRRWRAKLVGLSTAVGGLVAVVVGAACASAVVLGETGGAAVPAAAWLRLLPLAVLPVVTGLVAAAAAGLRSRRRESAWGRGFAAE
jgi:hypothetical protein